MPRRRGNHEGSIRKIRRRRADGTCYEVWLGEIMATGTMASLTGGPSPAQPARRYRRGSGSWPKPTPRPGW